MQAISSPPRSWQIVAVVAVMLAIAGGLCYSIWYAGQPVSLPSAAHEKLECASYTPSHNGHTLSVAEKRALVATDLALLAKRFRCVRTYSVAEGLDEVPRVARAVGLKVMLGLWISSHGPSNDKEIPRGIELANEYPDVVEAVIVGNEVLLRRDQTAAQLRAHIDRVRAGTTVPVTYADVWEFWLRNPDLANSTHFVTAHILPYWEDHPIGIDRALDHVQSIYGKVREAFPGKRVLIGETGWPSVGRPRLDAVPSPINQARFIREFVAYAERDRVPYNLIEAFDQPWKRIQEGTVGGYWGLYDASGAAKFAFTGPVTAFAAWRSALAVVLGVGILGALGGLAITRKPSALLLLFTGACAAGAMITLQWLYLSTSNINWLEWVVSGAWTIAGWSAYIAIGIAMTGSMGGEAIVRPAGIATIIRSLGHGAVSRTTSRRLGVFRFGVLVGATYLSLALAYEGRGRDFPLVQLALPVAAFALLEFVTPRNADSTNDNEEWLFVMCIALSSVYIAWHETAANTCAMLWCALNLVLAATVCVGEWRARRILASVHPDQRTEQQSHPA